MIDPRHLKSNQRHVLSRILLLRTIALSLALVLILVFEQQLGKSLLSETLVIVLIGGALLVGATFLRLKSAVSVSLIEIAVHLIADAILLIAFISLLGGATNPFIYYYLVLIAVAAATLTQTVAWLYCGSAVIAYSLMMYFDLADHAHHGFNEFQLHLVGMWFNFFGSAVLMCLFISRFAAALQAREAALAKTREENLRNEHLVGIGTVAASTAHNLGTPLNSISIILSEFDFNDKNEMRSDIDIALNQVERAKNTLRELQLLTEPEQLANKQLTIAQLNETLKEHYLLSNPRVLPTFTFDNATSSVKISTDILLQHAIINLIDNAVREAKQSVTVYSTLEKGGINIVIEDDGNGFSREQLKNWAQPVKQSEGLGIGIFLANHSIEKADGQVMAARTEDNKTRVVIELPLVKA